MKTSQTLNIGDYIQIEKFVKLYIDDIDLELENGKITVYFMCSEHNEISQTASGTRPYLQSEIENFLN